MATRMKEKTEKLLKNKDTRPMACAKYVRISPGKVMVVLDTIRGKSYDDAVGILSVLSRRSADIVLKVLKSAAANAENNMGLNAQDLYVAETFANQGQTLKRAYAGGKGSSKQILKRTSHITVVLDSKN